MRFTAGKRAALAVEREITEPDLEEKFQARSNFAHDVSHNRLLLRSQVESAHKTCGCFNRLFAELMDVQFAVMSIFDRNRENLRFKSCAAAHFARLACHECANAVARELALGLLIKSLHLRNQTFKWLRDFLLAINAQAYPHRFAIRAEVKRIFKFIRQIGKRYVFINMEMFHQRQLQVAIIRLHSLRSAAPRRDCPFGNRFARVRNHQVRINNLLCAQTVTGRTGTQVTVERKMSWSELAERESSFRVSVIGRVTDFFPNRFGLSVERWAHSACAQGRLLSVGCF